MFFNMTPISILFINMLHQKQGEFRGNPESQEKCTIFTRLGPCLKLPKYLGFGLMGNN